jgi:hypothetical protein
VTDRQRPNRGERQPPEIDIDLVAAQPARIYNYLAGGDANFAVDREAVDQAATILDGGLDTVRRAVASIAAFQARAVRYLVADAGVRQFLKLATAVPEGDDVHEVAQATAPDTRVVYVGDDPTVLAHAHALRRAMPGGVTGYVHGSLDDVEAIVEQAAETLDLDRPIGLLLPGALNFVTDEAGAYGIVTRFMDALAVGSHLAITHSTPDLRSGRMGEAAEKFAKLLAGSYVVRSRDDIARFFDGLELVDPGLVQIDEWRPAPDPDPAAAADAAAADAADEPVVPIYVALGRKP